MKIIYYSPYRIGSTSYSISYDDAITEAKNGADVLFLTCSGEIKYCNTNIYGSKFKCVQ